MDTLDPVKYPCCVRTVTHFVCLRDVAGDCEAIVARLRDAAASANAVAEHLAARGWCVQTVRYASDDWLALPADGAAAEAECEDAGGPPGACVTLVSSSPPPHFAP
jgi:hypothetical protein